SPVRLFSKEEDNSMSQAVISGSLLLAPFFMTNIYGVVFEDRIDSDIHSQALSISFQEQTDAEKASRFLMMKLMQAIESQTINAVRIQFKHHEDTGKIEDLPDDSVYPPQGISSQDVVAIAAQSVTTLHHLRTLPKECGNSAPPSEGRLRKARQSGRRRTQPA